MDYIVSITVGPDLCSVFKQQLNQGFMALKLCLLFDVETQCHFSKSQSLISLVCDVVNMLVRI